MKLNRVRRRCRDLLKIDRLIKLPDDMLINILERMGTLDALRACLVCKRMLNLPAKLSKIDIVLSPRDLFLKNDAVAHVFDKMLRTPPEDPIRRLKVRFILRLHDCVSIGKSAAFAMATQKHLDAAEFEILAPDASGAEDFDHFLGHFGQKLNTFIRECPDAFAGLTRLHLQDLRFGASDIANILSTCERLESLSLFQCDTGHGSVLHVQHARLVELDINFGKFSTVELIFLPKLQRFSYNNWSSSYEPFFLGFVPQLSKLALSCLNGTHIILRLSHMLVNAPPISNLYLGFPSKKIWIQPESPKLLVPLLGQLRLVNLDNLPEDCDISWTMFLLEAAPSLHELCVTLWDHECVRMSQRSPNEKTKTNVEWEPSVPDLKHKNLAKLTIHGFQSDDNFTKYVRRVLEVAVNIKEVSLHERKHCKVCTGKLGHLEIKVPLSRYPQTDEEKDLSRNKITEALVTASPAVIQFRPACHYSP